MRDQLVAYIARVNLLCPNSAVLVISIYSSTLLHPRDGVPVHPQRKVFVVEISSEDLCHSRSENWD